MGRVPSSEAGTLSTRKALRGGGSTPVERPEESAGGRQGHAPRGPLGGPENTKEFMEAAEEAFMSISLK